MKVIFLGGFFPKQFKSQILNDSKRQVQNAANKFQWGFINGLQENLATNLILITAPFIGWFPVYYKSIFFRGTHFSYANSDSGKMVGFVNLPIIKNFFKLVNLKKQLRKAINLADKTTIIIYSLDTPYLKAAIQLKAQYPNLRICVIVPDLHEFPGDSSLLYKWYIKFYEKPSFYKLLHEIDCFVLLSDEMAEYLNITKPWIRVEGLYEISSINDFKLPADKINKKIILYTGTLDFKYGINELLNAFNLIEDDAFELWICGGGVGQDTVQKAAARDARITYFGILAGEEISELQAKATLLVNPRNTIGDYNKYSFPSKTIEYLASGTPALIYKLEGIPKEYFKYCYTVDNNEVQTLSNAMKSICKLDTETLKSKGLEAREFILSHKTAESQCRKVMNMLENLV